MPDRAGARARFVAAAKEQIGARGADDGGSGVLRDHQPRERLGASPRHGSVATGKNGRP